MQLSGRTERRSFLVAAAGSFITTGRLAAGPDVKKKHVTVFKEPGRFGGWPANNGVWVWGNEILVGFSNGVFKPNDRGHAIDGTKPSYLRYGRSKDGGETWSTEIPSFLTEEGKERDPGDSPGGFDFTHPDTALTFRMVSSGRGYSRYYYSRDRGRNWQGPFKIPTYDRTGIASRTDYIVNGKHDLMAFTTAHKVNGREGRVFNIRTADGGKTWEFVSWIGPEPPGFSIMPSSLRLSKSRILTTLRCKDGDKHWIESWVSDDDGKSWKYLNEIASTGGSVGNPASMIMLRDGRLATTYGYRSAPYGMRARLSSDKGLTWGEEIVLRDDAGCWDLGYPRTVQRADGKIVTIYYHNDHPDRERYIAATIWDPGPAPKRA